MPKPALPEPVANPHPRIHVGIGGWTFEPWRSSFYPAGLPHAQELAWAGRRLTAIEINGSFYSTFTPAQYAKWRDSTPEGFVFSLKAHRFTTHRKLLATAGEGIARFVGSGIAELVPKLGPIVWQMMPTKRFEPDDLQAFLRLLPREAGGLPLRHVLDVRHESFACGEYLDLARRHGVSTVHAHSDKYPSIADAASPLAYLRLMQAAPDCPTGYAPQAIAGWARGAQAWVQDPRREVFCFFINGAKERAPQAAMEMLRQLAAA
jgi:uncharacterized protein YecE (DUF72 family)